MAAFYVYNLIDPRDGAVFYVGKGKGRRHLAHLQEAKSGKSGDKCDRIRAILADGKEPTAKIVERFSDEREAYAAEARLIKEIGLANLTNVSPGGNGGITQPADPQKEARKLVRRFHEIMRRAITFYNAGVSVEWRGLDFVKFGRDLALKNRALAGEEYFDRYVGVV